MNPLFYVLFALVGILVLLLANHAGVFDRFLGPLTGVRDRALDALGLTHDGLTSGDIDSALRRMWPLWILFVACFAVAIFLNPMKASLAVWGIGKITLGGVLGFIISFCVSLKAHRPEAPLDGIALGTALKCRTWIICATIIAMAFGVP